MKFITLAQVAGCPFNDYGTCTTRGNDLCGPDASGRFPCGDVLSPVADAAETERLNALLAVFTKQCSIEWETGSQNTAPPIGEKDVAQIIRAALIAA